VAGIERRPQRKDQLENELEIMDWHHLVSLRREKSGRRKKGKMKKSNLHHLDVKA